MTSYEEAVFLITREFVEDVKKWMIDKYNLLANDESHRFLIIPLLNKFLDEAVKAESTEKSKFTRYLSGDRTAILEAGVLNHAKQYKQVIIDILQEKVV